ncbi:ciliated left-right organizer ZP-N domains-containing protein [Lissotriton helveticus]
MLCLMFTLPALHTWGFPIEYRKNLELPITEISSDVECFADYMELWIPKGHVEGLIQWLSRTIRISISLVSLERLNLALSGSGYSLYMHPDGNYLFRAQYSAFFVQLENGNYILTIRIFKKYLAEAARSDHYIMKCPVVMSPLGREHVCCRSNSVQLTGRHIEEITSRWRFNKDVLTDQGNKTKIEEAIKDYLWHNETHDTDPKNIWEALKPTVRFVIIGIKAKINRNANQKLNKLEKDIKRLEMIHITNTKNTNTLTELNRKKYEYNKILSERAGLWVNRYKAINLCEANKAGKLLASYLKHKQRQHALSAITDSKKNTHTRHKEILRTFQEFYQDLYKKDESLYQEGSVSRPMPQGRTSEEVRWFLSLRGQLVVSVDDASLIGLNVELNSSSITVTGDRQTLLREEEVMNQFIEVLPLWLANGEYAYSLEANCPPVSSYQGDDVLVHVPKQRMGLVKRGLYSSESLTLKSLHVNQSSAFTVTENRHFVVINIPAAHVLEIQPCPEMGTLHQWQAFYHIDLILEYEEMGNAVHWTVENYYQCTDSASPPANGVIQMLNIVGQRAEL